METTPAPAEVAQSTVSPQEKGNGAATSVPESFSPTLTLQEIVALERPLVVPQVGRLLDATEICLFTARQKEGKSTLGLQLAIDVSAGDPFLGQYPTRAGTVLYIDYENRLDNLKKRGEDLLQGRTGENLHIKSFERIADKDVGLANQKERDSLSALVELHQPTLLIIDPLRLAWARDLMEDQNALKLLAYVSLLQKSNQGMSVILVHHCRKAQEATPVKLQSDPRSWIEKSYGSQALIAHVDSIWGLEEDGDGYIFASIARAHDGLLLRLEKEPESERFIFGNQETLSFKTSKQKDAWEKLPDEFGWREAQTELNISSNLMRNVLSRALQAGLLLQDSETKRYRKTK